MEIEFLAFLGGGFLLLGGFGLGFGGLFLNLRQLGLDGFLHRVKISLHGIAFLADALELALRGLLLRVEVIDLGAERGEALLGAAHVFLMRRLCGEKRGDRRFKHATLILHLAELLGDLDEFCFAATKGFHAGFERRFLAAGLGEALLGI